MSTDSFISHVAGHSGLAFDRAEHATREVLAGLGAYLTPMQRQFLADELPPSLGAALRAEPCVALPLEERVLEPGTTAGHAREIIASVCRVLAEELSMHALVVLRAALPRDLAELLATPSRDVAGPVGAPHRGTTIASGRPGSSHPLSEAHPRRVQDSSIADANPHAPTKLSSSSGTTQERRHETLADGGAGSDLPLSGARR